MYIYFTKINKSEIQQWTFVSGSYDKVTSGSSQLPCEIKKIKKHLSCHVMLL